MTLHLAVFTLVSLSAFAQAPTLNAVTGTIQSIVGKEFQIKTGTGLVNLYTDGETEVWKGKGYHDLSPLKVDDEIRIHCRGGASDKLAFAVRISASMTTFSGVIKTASSNTLEILVNPERPEIRLVRLAPDTVFGIGKKQPTVGQEVKVAGWDFGKSGVDAVRIAVYNTDLPVRAPDRERR